MPPTDWTRHHVDVLLAPLRADVNAAIDRGDRALARAVAQKYRELYMRSVRMDLAATPAPAGAETARLIGEALDVARAMLIRDLGTAAWDEPQGEAERDNMPPVTSGVGFSDPSKMASPFKTQPATPLTDEELVAMEARIAAASPGPWRWNDGEDIESATALDDRYPPEPLTIIKTDSRVYPPSDEDAAFIIGARVDMPRLLAEVRRLREAAANVITSGFVSDEVAYRVEHIERSSGAFWAGESAKHYQCPACRRWVASTYEGKERPTIACHAPDGGHTLAWIPTLPSTWPP